ncbi:MAG: serine/threonine-protein kinase, partial [Acidobacteriota bacterium]|nr:serine/threonine-protein kinase [Acidobacteriota bacterium]
MDPDRWRLVREIFDAAVALPASERLSFVQEQCAGDPALVEEVESLLCSHEEAGTFIDRPAVEGVEGLEALTTDSPGMPPPGTLVGRYRLERLLGSGGMGSVFLAVRADDEYRQQVAVKLLRSDLMTPELAHRFRSERQILADLDHPNIARLLDGGTTDDGRPYLVMEHVEGEPLDLYCDRRRLSTAERLRLFQKICAAVHFAHQSLVVHRDLKPGNILVTEAGEPKLLDFGIAKLLDSGGDAPTLGATGTGLAPMTPEYASPEQVRGESITTASDVYSLGVLLYDLLTGHRPYYWHRRSA